MKEKTYLLATDLDHTLVGDRSALSELFAFYQDNQLDPALVYVTGRHLDSALALIEQENLPAPDILITDVGTAIYHAPDWTEDSRWSALVNETWAPNTILKALQNFDAAKQQNLPHNKRISFTLPTNNPDTLRLIQDTLDKHGAHCHLVYSSGRDLDILPERSGKGKAVEYILQQYANESVQVLLAGDSGNDAEMLLLPFPAVIVGNAQPELNHLSEDSFLYRAAGHYAQGILEAWNHYYLNRHKEKPIGLT